MIRYKVGDSSPSLLVQLQCEAGFDLTGSPVVTFNLYKPDGTIVSRTSTIVNAATNVVRHDWQATDMDQEGRYYGEFVVSSGGLQRTFPPDNYVNIRVSERPA